MTDIEKTIDREKELAAYDGRDRVVHRNDFLKIKEAEHSKVRSYSSGFEMFDKKLGGLATGEVTVISGRTGEGKTLFAETWLHRLLKSGICGCFFSFEVTATVIAERFAEEDLIYFPLELQAMNTDWLHNRIEEAKIKYECRIFVLDHLHFLVDMATKQNMSLNIGGFMRRLKTIALGLNVAIILIAHQDKGERGQEPSIEGIRDSTFIAQEADNVLIVYRRKDFLSADFANMPSESQAKIQLRMTELPDPAEPFKNGFAIIQIAKARRTGTFRWPKLFQKSGNYLEEV